MNQTKQKAIVVHRSTVDKLNDELDDNWTVHSMQPFIATGSSTAREGSILVILNKQNNTSTFLDKKD